MFAWNQIGLQVAGSPVMEEFIYFNDFVMTILLFIMTLVLFVIGYSCTGKISFSGLLEGQALECLWTIAPALVLIQVAAPSLYMLYILDDFSNCSITLKVEGHQWYWSYGYNDFWTLDQGLEEELSFDSYMTPISGVSAGEFRLLEGDNRVVLPYGVQTRVVVTSADVLHSWAVPSLGVKADANPGRLNQLKFLARRPGFTYGQCSEICGAEHSFMPITLEFIQLGSFLSWVAGVA